MNIEILINNQTHYHSGKVINSSFHVCHYLLVISFHLNQTESSILLQGQLAYQPGDTVYTCDMHTCPRSLIIPSLQSHTFWMDDNNEDLIILLSALIGQLLGCKIEYKEYATIANEFN